LNILLIPSFNFEGAVYKSYVPYGLLALQAEEKRFPQVTIDIANPGLSLQEGTFEDSSEVVEQFLSKTDFDCYDVVGFSAVCNSVHYALGIAKRIKALNPSQMIVFGGPYMTKVSERVLEEFSFIDAVFIGEAEHSFARFLNSLRPGASNSDEIQGMYTRGRMPRPAPVVQDLDDLPLISEARSYFEWLSFQRDFGEEDTLVPVEATRGCPLKCSFCSTKQVWGPKVRRKSARRLIDELAVVNRETGATFFSLTGDNVGVPRNQFIHFCEDMIREGNRFTWACSLKLDRLSTENLELMWKAGCRGLFVGIETASQETLRLVNKAARLDNEIAGIKTAIKLGFMVETSFIIGFPWESESDVRATYDLHCDFIQRGAKRSQVGVLCPIPGTEIVANEQIVFDNLHASLSYDGIQLSADHSKMALEAPDLFSYFGRYETPNVRRSVLKAYRDAAAHLSGMQAKRWRDERAVNASDGGSLSRPAAAIQQGVDPCQT